MVITVPAGFRVESLSARARGITDGAGRTIRATDTIADRSVAGTLAAGMSDADMKAADTLAVGMKAVDMKGAALPGADLLDAVQLLGSMVERHAVVRSMAEAGLMVAVGPVADAGNGKLEI